MLSYQYCLVHLNKSPQHFKRPIVMLYLLWKLQWNTSNLTDWWRVWSLLYIARLKVWLKRRELNDRCCLGREEDHSGSYSSTKHLQGVVSLEKVIINAANNKDFEGEIKEIEKSCFSKDIDFSEFNRQLPLLHSVATNSQACHFNSHHMWSYEQQWKFQTITSIYWSCSPTCFNSPYIVCHSWKNLFSAKVCFYFTALKAIK